MQRLKLLIIPSTTEKMAGFVMYTVCKIGFMPVTSKEYREQKIRIHMPNFRSKWKLMKQLQTGDLNSNNSSSLPARYVSTKRLL